MMDYSQYGETTIINRYLPDSKPRVYVDIGAGEPFLYSNTYKYYLEGGKGLLVEPLGVYNKELEEKRPKDILVRAAITDYDGECEMVDTSTVGSAIGDIYKYIEKLDSKPYKVKCLTMDSLIKLYPEFKEPDFMSMDIETNEEKALSKCDFNIFKPYLIVIEFKVRDVDYREKWGRFLEPYYDLRDTNVCNAFYTRKK